MIARQLNGEVERACWPTTRCSGRGPGIRWGPSPLILVFSAPRQGRARELLGLNRPYRTAPHDPCRPDQLNGGASPPDLKDSRHGDTVSDPACHGACSRKPSAAPRLRSCPISRPGPQRDSLFEHQASSAGTVERHRRESPADRHAVAATCGKPRPQPCPGWLLHAAAGRRTTRCSRRGPVTPVAALAADLGVLRTTGPPISSAH